MDRDVEDLLFKVAKKDKHSKGVYERFVELKETFNSLISNIQTHSNLTSNIKEIEDKVNLLQDNFKSKYADSKDSIDIDLQNIIADNLKIKAKLKSQ